MNNQRIATFIQARLDDLGRILTTRRDNYAPPPVNFQRIADYWTIDLSDKLKPGVKITPLDVAQAMISVKKARILAGYRRDHADDGAGYFICMEVCEEYTDEPATTQTPEG